MNHQQTVNRPAAFEPLVARALAAVPGLAVTAEAVRADGGVDAVLEFAGAATRVAVQVKSRASAAAAWQLVQYAAAQQGVPVLLVAGETTADARRILREHGIGILDSLGNAHVELPGLLVHVEGGEPRQLVRPARLRGKAGVVAQALLLDPSRGWQVRDLAEEAAVSAGLAHRVLARLEGEGLVVSEGAASRRVRRVTSPAGLLDLWAEEDSYWPDSTRAFVLAQGPRQLVIEVGRNLDAHGIDYAVTGAAAAGLVAPFVTAVPVAEVWVTAGAVARGLPAAAGGDAVDGGHNVVFLQAKDDTPLAFREQLAGLRVANRFRLYADLRRDPRRGREQAERLRQEVIGF